MVRFAPGPVPFWIVREGIPPADEYRTAPTPDPLADRVSSTSDAVECLHYQGPGVEEGLPSDAVEGLHYQGSGAEKGLPSDAVECLHYQGSGMEERLPSDTVGCPSPNGSGTEGNLAPPLPDPTTAPTPPPDPFTDADALEELEEEVVTLAAHIHAATHRLLTLIAEFDRRRGWELGGHRTCAHWLSFRTGIDLGAAREKVRAARALEELPETSASMARGELSFSKVRALTRVATPGNEGDLVALAQGCTAAQLERMVRAFSRCTRREEGDLDRIRHERRCLSVFPDDDGMYLVRGRLPAGIGALLMRAVEAASDALFREEWAGGGRGRGDGGPSAEGVSGAVPPRCVSAEPGGPVAGTAGHARSPVRETAEPNASETLRPCADSERRAAQRRADALGLLAERALAAGFEDGPISGTRAARYQVVLHVEAETLRAGERLGSMESSSARSELEDGTRVSAETSRRISCDAGLVRVTHAPHGADSKGGTLRGPVRGARGQGVGGSRGVAAGQDGVGAAQDGDGPAQDGVGAAQDGVGAAQDGVGPAPDGSILDVGRRTRTIPPALRRALEVRDRGCRFPGCGSRFTDAHHVTHWADGGETSLANTLLLCRHHHRLVHEGGWTVDWWGWGRPVFFDPRGGTHFEGRWQPPVNDEGVSEEGIPDEGVPEDGVPEDGVPDERVPEEGIPDEGVPENGVPDERVPDERVPDEGVSAETSGRQKRLKRTNPEDLVESLLTQNRRQDIVPDGRTPSARWKRESDIPVRVYLRALEAIQERGP